MWGGTKGVEEEEVSSCFRFSSKRSFIVWSLFHYMTAKKCLYRDCNLWCESSFSSENHEAQRILVNCIVQLRWKKSRAKTIIMFRGRAIQCEHFVSIVANCCKLRISRKESARQVFMVINWFLFTILTIDYTFESLILEEQDFRLFIACWPRKLTILLRRLLWKLHKSFSLDREASATRNTVFSFAW